MEMINSIKQVLQDFDPVSLEELVAYKLLNRIDTKYICNAKKMPHILTQAINDFKVQTINSERIFRYESLYFDTIDLKTYFDHHQGRRLRYKVRFRKYIDTGDSFLELKKKINDVRTDKKRLEFEFSSRMEKEHLKFLKKHVELPHSEFNPNIWTVFDRITLAGKTHLERITIDLNICFKNNSQEILMPNLAIIEVKRNKTESPSSFTQILRDCNIQPIGISKYVLGNIILNPRIKHNRFSHKINTINKICHDTKCNI